MFTLEIIKAIVLGIVEGLTEWLPVSSTGHMILVDEFMSLNVSKAFMDMFLVVIQLGAILAVVTLNFDRLNPFSKRKTYLKKRQTISLWGKVIVGCIPAAVIGLAKKNVYSVATTREVPNKIPPKIVEPERDVPGTKDNT